MPDEVAQTLDEDKKDGRIVILKYDGEDDRSFFVFDPAGVRLIVPKQRAVPEPAIGHSSSPMAPVFRLLLVAFLGLAPSGLGALVLAPLAALWALAILFTHRLGRVDRIRLAVALGMAAVLLAVAIPMARLFLARLP